MHKSINGNKNFNNELYQIKTMYFDEKTKTQK